MRFVFLTTLTMVAFAANSVLNRLALEGGETGPASFALIRLASGALMLVFLMAGRRQGMGAVLRWPGWAGPGMLALYVLGFSFAYVTLGAGVGALILFGGVQLTMFSGALVNGEDVPLQRWLGAGLSFAGLCYLMWPAGGAAPDLGGSALMAAAALGWGVYSLIGRGARDPLGATASNFIWAAPVGLVPWIVLPDGADSAGVVLAILSGAVTSGLGYALWYLILPGLGATRAAVAQLTVPVIAIAGGAILLGETLSLRVVLASVMVLGGVLIAVRPVRRSSSDS